ncbi:MAG: AmmeMemoRadiSam system protein A, partial [Gammaproteobacteria bacterium]
IGSLEARRAIGHDVAENAAAAAFRDPRFKPLTAAEYLATQVEVSQLSPVVTLDIVDEDSACASLRPHVDGVIFECRGQRATFLPQVWTQFPEAHVFLRHLKQKAGFEPAFWSSDVRLSRYTVRKWCEP